MNKIANQFSSIGQVADKYFNQKDVNQATQSSEISFADVLKQKQEVSQPTETSELKFSKHASMRLEDRNITLSDEQSERLESGVAKAGEKGINESLVVVDSLAFIVNIPNKTVVTAIDQTESDNHVFTNIDGAVIA